MFRIGLVRAAARAAFMTLLLATGSAAQGKAPDAAPMLTHILGYIAVDYPSTVSGGKVVNAGEYEEQREFAGRLVTLIRTLPPTAEKPALAKQAADLLLLIESRAAGEKVAAEAESLRERVLQAYQVEIVPRAQPDLARGAALYANQCAGCHGLEGRGDGSAAKGLAPAPADFHDRKRQDRRSVYALYNTISLGVAGTAMQAYAESLAESDRWALAFHVANFLASDQERSEGAALISQEKYRTRFSARGAVTAISPAQARSELGEAGSKALAYLRSAPNAIDQGESPLLFSARKLEESAQAYRARNPEDAYVLAVSAYLEGFELVERSLVAVDPQLKQRIESDMYAYRGLIKAHAGLEKIDTARDALLVQLAEARTLLENHALSPGVAYSSSLVILLREGLEAILLLAVVVAFVIKTGRRRALRYIHIGWISALLLGFGTWGLATYVINISGASRELTEGLTALLAAVVLIYLGFWLHNEAHARKWKAYIEESMQQGASGDRGLWGIALVAFIAVYREVFETVLFYQALWLQAGIEGRQMVVMGLLTAVAALVVVSWLIFRFSVRLPLKLFFQVNAVLLYVLAVVFAGQGVAALQEAGKLPVTPVTFPRFDLLGIYPNMQSLGLQAALISLAALVLVASMRRGATANPQASRAA